MLRHPDNPQEVSLDFLRRLDTDPPYTWMAQPKYDGRRRVISKDNGVYTWRAKNRDDAQIVPYGVRGPFERMCWHDGTTLDCEWVGPRHAGGAHSLHIFDMLEHPEAGWLGNTPFDVRVVLLSRDFAFARLGMASTDPIHLVPFRRNPGLVEYYKEQLTDPLSEGLVVRKSLSLLVGSTIKPATNKEWYKVKFKREKGMEP